MAATTHCSSEQTHLSIYIYTVIGKWKSCHWFHFQPPSLPLWPFHLCAYPSSSGWPMTRLANANWSKHLIYFVIQCLFCDGHLFSGGHYMWYKNLHTSQPILSVHPRVSITHSLVYNLSVLFLLGFWPASKIIHFCQGVRTHVCTYTHTCIHILTSGRFFHTKVIIKFDAQSSIIRELFSCHYISSSPLSVAIEYVPFIFKLYPFTNTTNSQTNPFSSINWLCRTHNS